MLVVIPKLDKIEIQKINGNRMIKCCYCDSTVSHSILPHMREKHPREWEEWREEMLRHFNKGLNPKQIMKSVFSVGSTPLITWSVIEKEIIKMIEEGREVIPPVRETIVSWEPKNFKLETGTIWRFPKRGNWATHSGNYRGNWPPQLPRNLILRYTKLGDFVLDPFVGGGTTIIECKLLGRNALGIDINPFAIEMTRRQLEVIEEESERQKKELPLASIESKIGDARDLSMIDDNEVDLICAHPPYFNSLHYTWKVRGDLSRLKNLDEFLSSVQDCAEELFRTLKKGGICGVLIGDVRKNGKIIPLAFRTMEIMQKIGFELREIIVKEQYNDRSSAFYVNSNILKIEHEYLFIFKKPE